MRKPDPQAECDRWNQHIPVGSEVSYVEVMGDNARLWRNDMNSAVSRLLNRTKARLHSEEQHQNRRVVRALIAHIEGATPLRDGESPFSSRLRSHGSGSYLLFCVGFFAGVSIVLAVAMRVAA